MQHVSGSTAGCRFAIVRKERASAFTLPLIVCCRTSRPETPQLGAFQPGAPSSFYTYSALHHSPERSHCKHGRAVTSRIPSPTHQNPEPLALDSKNNEQSHNRPKSSTRRSVLRQHQSSIYLRTQTSLAVSPLHRQFNHQFSSRRHHQSHRCGDPVGVASWHAAAAMDRAVGRLTYPAH
jgi:hypothetical protein